ncbi:TetR/AcrR family transcriptional regulator [Flavisphingomonas formosensis]|uniref:TetR/AcrR family transcriptional regulator n=1 Tax=Flavisphingomonas formosensis TaxID=861534 RepID=UPI0018DFE29A|nr:TetR/AcrR family transcriptional regulator [Sphingomonas formosensis]
MNPRAAVLAFPAPRARGRPRDPEVDARVIGAARRLLAEKGYEALSFEAIAQETGIGKPTIYRRWPTKAHLAAEIATGDGAEGLPDIVVQEGLAAQIRAIFAQAASFYGRPGMKAAVLGVLASAQSDAALRDQFNRLEEATRGELRTIVAKGQAAGLIRDGIDVDTLFDMISGSVIFRMMLSEAPMPRDYVDAAAAQIVRSLAPAATE